MKKYFLLSAFLFILHLNSSFGQVLSLEELISSPVVDADKTDEILKSKGWEQYSYEINKDSGFVKHVWMIKNSYNDLKSYFSYYKSDVLASENHTTYQFSDRTAFNEYINTLKSKGYKLIADKKKKSKKKKDKNKSKDKEYLFLSEKDNSLIHLKEVFMLGLNAFLVDTYNSKSQIAQQLLEQKQ